MLRKHGRSTGQGTSSGKETARRFSRFLDDVADGDLPGGLELLNLIRAQIDAGPIGRGLQTLFLRCKFLRRGWHFLGSCTRFNRRTDFWTGGRSGTVAIENEAELIVYAYRVAGTVKINS